MLRVLLLLTLIWTPRLAADTPEEQARHAAIYVAARQYDRALEIYRELLNTSLSDWQRSTVLFDIATVLLEQQRWEEAVRAFEEVPITPDSSPLLRRRYDYNKAVSLLGLVKSQVNLYAITDPAFTDKARQLEKILIRAIKSLDQAQAAECELAQLEGNEQCRVQSDIVVGKQRAKQLLAILQNLQEQNRFEDLSIGGQLSDLIVTLGEINRWLQYIDADADDDKEKQSLAVAQSVVSLEPCWKILITGLSGNDDFGDARRQLISNAQSEYAAGLAHLQKGIPGKARAHLEASSHWLRGVLDMEAGDDIEALFKMRLMADRMGDASADFLKTLDGLIQQWLKVRLPYLPTHDANLVDAITKNRGNPAKALLLYRVAIGRYGAIVADLLARNPFDPNSVKQAVQVIAPYAGTNQSLLQTVIVGSAEQLPSRLESFAILTDLSGFLQERLGNLFENYLLAVAHRQLRNDTFQRLGLQLDQLKRFIELPEVGKIAGVSGPALVANLGNALADQTWGMKALTAQQPAAARLFFGEVAFWLGATAKRGLGLVPEVPEQLLTMAVAEEQHAMQVVSAVMELPETQRQAASAFAEPLHDTMRLAQKQTQVWSAPFVGAVLARQRQAFDSKGSGDSCQRYPWDEVLPLYFLGEAAADRATQNLALATTSLSTVLGEQKVAYRKWLKALEMLRQGKSKGVASKQPEDKIQPQGGVSPVVQAPSNAIDDILRQLQQMDREDRSKTEGKQPLQGGGGKPW